METRSSDAVERDAPTQLVVIRRRIPNAEIRSRYSSIITTGYAVPNEYTKMDIVIVDYTRINDNCWSNKFGSAD